MIEADGSPKVLIGGKRQVTDYHFAGGVIAATVADEKSCGELVVLSERGENVVTNLGESLARCGLFPMEEVSTEASDGYPVHGWLIKPPGNGPFPLILLNHGGPDIQFGYSLIDEAQVYADAGFAVLIGNPRGSVGYGETHARAIRGRLGTVDAEDIVALYEKVRRRSDIRPDPSASYAQRIVEILRVGAPMAANLFRLSATCLSSSLPL